MTAFCFAAAYLAAAIAGTAPSSIGGPQATQEERAEDLEFALRAMEQSYAYPVPFEWTEVGAKYRDQLAKANDSSDFFRLMERLVDELQDHHAHLAMNGSQSFRLSPSGLDAWIDFEAGAWKVSEVREDSPAEKAGLRAGAQLVSIDAVPIADAVAQRLSRLETTETDAAKAWAARTLLAGRQDQATATLTVTGQGPDPLTLHFARGGTRGAPGLLTERLDPNGTQYVRIENSLGQDGLVTAFDGVMDGLGDSKTLVLDLTNTPGGGNSMVARGLIGRFVSETTPYQRHEFSEGSLGIVRSWVEEVRPRGGAAFTGNLLVLVNHWTGSMGEGLAIGLDALPNSTVIGLPMAGLRGATDRFTLPHSGIDFYLPTERLYHVDGYPRESFYPDRLATPSADATTRQALDAQVEEFLTAEARRAAWQVEVPAWISASQHSLASVEPEAADDADLAWLKDRVKGIRVFAMGESTHGTSEFFRVRLRLTRYLIEHAGFNAVAFESSAATAIACDRYIRGEDIALERAVKGLGMAIWQVEELRALLVDLRELNEGRESPVRFFGVDMQSPRSSSDHLKSVLIDIDEALGAKWSDRLDQFADLVENQGGDSSADAEQVSKAVAELRDLWGRNREAYTEQLGAFTYLETARQMNALEQNLTLASTMDWSLRDAAMAKNTLGIFDVLGDGAKVILWAHNAHVFKGAMAYAGTDNLGMGGCLAEAIGDDYYSLGLIFNQGQFQANAYSEEGKLRFRRYHFDEAPLGSLAAYFAATGVGASILDFADRPAAGTVLEWLDASHGARWVGGYNVADDINRRTRSASALMTYSPGRDFDGILYIDQTTAASPLNKTMLDARVFGD